MNRVRPVGDVAGGVAFDLRGTEEERTVPTNRRGSAPPLPVNRLSQALTSTAAFAPDPADAHSVARSSVSSQPTGTRKGSTSSLPGQKRSSLASATGGATTARTTGRASVSSHKAGAEAHEAPKSEDAERAWRKELEKKVDPSRTELHGLACKLRHGHGLGVYSVHYSKDGKWLVSGSHDGRVVIWSVEEERFVRSLREVEAPVFQVAFSPDSAATHIATACADGMLRVYHRKTGDLRLELPNQVRPPPAQHLGG